MPYNNYSRPSNNYGRQGYQGRPNQVYAPAAPIQPKQLPQEYVDEAERVIREVSTDKNCISTSKLRGFLALLTEIYNEESLRTEKTISANSQAKLLRLRVRIVYDAGREQAVRKFIEKAQLLEYIKGVGNDRENLIQLSHYMEALVAYHRYLINKEN